MLKIAVCDDERLYVNKLARIIESYAEQNSLSLTVTEYTDGNALIENKIKYDLIFLDIEMDNSNGIEIAGKIRMFDLNVPIVYVTSYSDYWRRAYKVHAFDFILKPFKQEDIFNVLTDFLKCLKDQNSKSIEIVTDHGIEVQPLNDIYYFILLAKRQVLVSTIDKEYIAKANLTEIFTQICNDGFYQSHRSCIVNLKYVQTIKKNDGILMLNGEWVPLAQKKQKDFFFHLSKQLRK